LISGYYLLDIIATSVVDERMYRYSLTTVVVLGYT
jgi:hypothetical protein